MTIFAKDKYTLWVHICFKGQLHDSYFHLENNSITQTWFYFKLMSLDCVFFSLLSRNIFPRFLINKNFRACPILYVYMCLRITRGPDYANPGCMNITPTCSLVWKNSWTLFMAFELFTTRKFTGTPKAIHRSPLWIILTVGFFYGPLELFRRMHFLRDLKKY